MNWDKLLSLDFYEYLILEPLFQVYSAIEKPPEKWLKYSNLIIDKFAIHSSSYYHLSKGIIELKEPREGIKSFGYDLFTANTTYRAILETYATYNHIYIEPKDNDEKRFRYLLWKIDGLNEKLKYDIKESDFQEAKQIFANDRQIHNKTIEEIQNCNFYKSASPKEIEKIFNPIERKFKWKFINQSGVFKPLNITSLVEHSCVTRSFRNSYRHASTHSHSSFLSIEEFERYRGKAIPDTYFQPFIKNAIFITSMLVYDICTINEKSAQVFLSLPVHIQEFITGMTLAINPNKCEIIK
jgi:hypothetical protein